METTTVQSPSPVISTEEKSIRHLYEEHTDFTLSTFTEATPRSSLLKLHDELQEVYAALDENASTAADIAEEYVDCVMCLFDSAARMGIYGAMFERIFRAKLARNKARTWLKNEDNTYSHVKK